MSSSIADCFLRSQRPCCTCRRPLSRFSAVWSLLPHKVLAVRRTPAVARAAGSDVDKAGTGPTSDSTGPIAWTPSLANVEKGVTKFARGAATTFAPRASGATKNPAYRGSWLYTVFEVQAWLSLAVGGLLSFNLLFPTDQPSIARMLGMWSIWMFTVPSLRARECDAAEKDALNLLFLAIPLLNVTLPFLWRSFAFVYSADVVALAAVFAWKGVLPGSAREEAS